MVKRFVMPPAYPSDISDAEWTLWEPLIPAVKPGGRPHGHPDRELIEAMLSVPRGGVAWRALPREYPPWKTVYHSVRVWRLNGNWERMNTQLRAGTRLRADRSAELSAGLLNSQSAKITEKGSRTAGMERSDYTDASAISLWIRAGWC